MVSEKEWALLTAEKYWLEEEQKEEINYQHRSQSLWPFLFFFFFLLKHETEFFLRKWIKVEKYPQFKAMYQTLYEMCRNTERVMRMFSKELRELDRNTVKYQMKEENEKKDQLIAELKRQLTEKEDLHG